MKPTDTALRRLPTWLASPATVTLVFALAYLAAIVVHAGGDPLELARIGTRFSEANPAGSEGYDGQFVYYIARDPLPQSVAPHIDEPAYRYQRILLPMLARALALGSPDLIPWVIPAISLAAHVLAVQLLSRLLTAWEFSRWYALSYGLWLGLLYALRLDLPEALAFALIVVAIYAQYRGKSSLAWLAYGLALFAKETTLFFLAAQLLISLIQRRGRDALALGLVALLPFALFQFWLWQAFGRVGLGLGGAGATPLEWFPFIGLWRVGAYSVPAMFALFIAYLPTLILPALWGLWAAWQRWRAEAPEFTQAALFLNAAIVPFLSFALYREPIGAFRFASGLILATLLFAARHRLTKILNYSLLAWLAMDAVLLAEFFLP